MAGEMNLKRLLSDMKPSLQEGRFVFCTLQIEKPPVDLDVVASFREKEGLTVVVEEREAQERGWDYEVAMAWITLTVHSALEAVGLTAAVANALTQEDISCNVIAAYYHDHIFVPVERAEEAMQALQRISETTAV